MSSSPDHGDQLVEVYDHSLKKLYKVPSQAIPAAQAQATRLVLCRNHRHEVPGSCPNGDACKFVHLSMDVAELEEPAAVHVKYLWHHQDDCTYPRLPAGEVLRVSAPNNRMPFDNIPSDCVLATRGALNRHTHGGQLSHCAHYLFSKLCKRGSDCHFIHAVIVDRKNVPQGHFLRISANRARKLIPLVKPAYFSAVTVAMPEAQEQDYQQHCQHGRHTPTSQHSHDEGTPRSISPNAAAAVEGHRASEPDFYSEMYVRSRLTPQLSSAGMTYRHNPYSLSAPLVYVLAC